MLVKLNEKVKMIWHFPGNTSSELTRFCETFLTWGGFGEALWYCIPLAPALLSHAPSAAAQACWKNVMPGKSGFPSQDWCKAGCHSSKHALVLCKGPTDVRSLGGHSMLLGSLQAPVGTGCLHALLSSFCWCEQSVKGSISLRTIRFHVNPFLWHTAPFLPIQKTLRNS